MPVFLDEKGLPKSKYWKENRTRNQVQIIEMYCSAKCSLINYEKDRHDITS